MPKFIPLYPEGVFNLTQQERNCLTWYVLSDCNKNEAFSTFVRPDLAANPTILSQYAQQFFASANAISYIEAYGKAVNERLNPVHKEKKKLTKEEQDKRNAEAVQKVVEWVIAHSDNIDAMEHPEDLIKMMQRLGMLGDEEVLEEAPRRYLPEMCGMCRYKRFIERECDDDCDKCKYKEYAEENGVRFTPEEQLNKN